MQRGKGISVNLDRIQLSEVTNEALDSVTVFIGGNVYARG